MSSTRQPIDQRAFRTRNQIARAVIMLGQQRGVDKLTVGELAREAGVSRSTFYAHFSSLEHYLAQSFGNMVESYASHGARQAGAADRRLLHVRPILDHVANAPGYVAVISRSRFRPRMLLAGEDRLRRYVEARIPGLRPDIPRSERAAISRFVAAGFIGMLRDWMESGLKRSPDQFEQQFDAIIARI